MFLCSYLGLCMEQACRCIYAANKLHMWAGNSNSTFYHISSAFPACQQHTARILNKEEDFKLRLAHLIDNRNNKVHFQNVLSFKYPNLDFVNVNHTGSQMLKCHRARAAGRQGNLTDLNSLQILNDTQPQAGNHSKNAS